MIYLYICVNISYIYIILYYVFINQLKFYMTSLNTIDLLKNYIDLGVCDVVDIMPSPFVVETNINSKPKKIIDKKKDGTYWLNLALDYANKSNSVDELITNCEKLKEFPHVKRILSTNTLFFSQQKNKTQYAIIMQSPDILEEKYNDFFKSFESFMVKDIISSFGLDCDDFTFIRPFFWYIPGGREPNDLDYMICLPFIYRLLSICDIKSILIFDNNKKFFLNEKRSTRLLFDKVNFFDVDYIKNKFKRYNIEYYIDLNIKVFCTWNIKLLVNNPNYKKLSVKTWIKFLKSIK